LRLRHSRAWFLSTPTKKRDFFNYSLSDGIGLDQRPQDAMSRYL
jgi:hypothetical protein